MEPAGGCPPDRSLPAEVDPKVPQYVATTKTLPRLSSFFPVWCNLSEDWQQLQENCFRYLLIF